MVKVKLEESDKAWLTKEQWEWIHENFVKHYQELPKERTRWISLVHWGFYHQPGWYFLTCLNEVGPKHPVPHGWSHLDIGAGILVAFVERGLTEAIFVQDHWWSGRFIQLVDNAIVKCGYVREESRLFGELKVSLKKYVSSIPE